MNFKVIRYSALLAALVVLPWSASVDAKGFELPLKLSWCQDRASVEAVMESPREANDDVVESTARIWKIDGFLSTVFDGGKLVKIQVRFYETADHVKKVRSSLEKMLGKSVEVGETQRWQAGSNGKVEMKVQTEQVYATFEAPEGTCGSGSETKTGLTEQEKADLDAMRDKQAVEWDPYAEEEEDAPIVKKKAKKEEEEEEEEEEKEEELEDEDIDW